MLTKGLGLAISLALITAGSAAAQSRTYQVCEGPPVNGCATWTFNGNQGNGTWENGETADLTWTARGPRSFSATVVFTGGRRAGTSNNFSGQLSREGFFAGTVHGRAELHPWRAALGPVSQELGASLKLVILVKRVPPPPSAPQQASRTPPAVASPIAAPRTDEERSREKAQNEAMAGVRTRAAMRASHPPVPELSTGGTVSSTHWLNPNEPMINPAGWDKLRWGMSRAEVAKLYPDAHEYTSLNERDPVFGIDEYGVGDTMFQVEFDFVFDQLSTVWVRPSDPDPAIGMPWREERIAEFFIRGFTRATLSAGTSKKDESRYKGVWRSGHTEADFNRFYPSCRFSSTPFNPCKARDRISISYSWVH